MKKKVKTILASASPRRNELLNLIHIYPEVKIPEIEEIPLQGELPENFVTRVALEKGLFIAKNQHSSNLIISADTIVLDGDKIIGKPVNKEDAVKMLTILSGKRHKVITGISLLFNGKENAGTSVTEVEFADLSNIEIKNYLNTESYMDKAGAYAIQGKASIFVKKIDGCYFNVMGFPLNLFYTMIKELNIILEDLTGRV